MNAVEELATILRPSAGGLYVVSTGRAEQLAIQRELYGVDREEDVARLFRFAPWQLRAWVDEARNASFGPGRNPA